MSEYDESFETCDDCGRQFPRSELRRCKKCGHYVCPECRGTHVAKYHQAPETQNYGASYPGSTTPEEPAPVQNREEEKSSTIPSFTFNRDEQTTASSSPEDEKPSTIPSFTFNRDEQTTASSSPEEEKSSTVPSFTINREEQAAPVHSQQEDSDSHVRIPPYVPHVASHSAETVACVDCGREFPVSRMKKCNICNGAVCPHCQETHLSKKHGHFLYADYAPASTSNGESKEKSSSIHFKQDLDQNPIGQAASYYNYSNPTPSQQNESQPYHEDPGDGRIQCDDCGQYFNKEELRTCRKCGHHVCEKCRTHHKCPKPQKAEKPPKEPKQPKEKPPKEPKQHWKRKHDELGDPSY